MDDDITEKEDSDPAYGVSDGVSFLGLMAVDKQNYANGDAPCFGMEGMSGGSLTGSRLISRFSRPNDSFYPDQFIITLKLNENWGSCYTAHDGGFVKTAATSDCCSAMVLISRSTKTIDPKELG